MIQGGSIYVGPEEMVIENSILKEMSIEIGI